ncbi:MAG: hypothetical protein SNG38_07255, partial [Rikenellaceae bacterium]
SIFDFAKVGCSSSTTYFCKIKKGWLVIEKYFREKLELPLNLFRVDYNCSQYAQKKRLQIERLYSFLLQIKKIFI